MFLTVFIYTRVCHSSPISHFGGWFIVTCPDIWNKHPHVWLWLPPFPSPFPQKQLTMGLPHPQPCVASFGYHSGNAGQIWEMHLGHSEWTFTLYADRLDRKTSLDSSRTQRKSQDKDILPQLTTLSQYQPFNIEDSQILEKLFSIEVLYCTQKTPYLSNVWVRGQLSGVGFLLPPGDRIQFIRLGGKRMSLLRHLTSPKTPSFKYHCHPLFLHRYSLWVIYVSGCLSRRMI